MKTKRKFLGKLHFDLLMLLIFWVIVHCLGWYSNGFKDFLSSQLIYLTLSITLLLLLLLSSKGNDKDYTFGLPLMNSYKETPFGIVVTPGGFNLLMRLFYLVIALILIILAFLKDGQGNTSFFDIIIIVVFALILIFQVINYFKNRNDFFSIDQHAISWFDNENKNVLNVDLESIIDFNIKKSEDTKYNYPKIIILKTSDKDYSINLEEMSILQFSDQIITQLKVRLQFIYDNKIK